MCKAAFLYLTVLGEDVFSYYKNSCTTINHVPIALSTDLRAKD